MYLRKKQVLIFHHVRIDFVINEQLSIEKEAKPIEILILSCKSWSELYSIVNTYVLLFICNYVHEEIQALTKYIAREQFWANNSSAETDNAQKTIEVCFLFHSFCGTSD